jgi:hypothetical protein
MKRWEKALAASPFIALALVLGTCTWFVTRPSEETKSEPYVSQWDRLRTRSEALLEKEGKPAKFDQACYDEAYRSQFKHVAEHPQDYPDNPDPEYQATGFARFQCRILVEDTAHASSVEPGTSDPQPGPSPGLTFDSHIAG